MNFAHPERLLWLIPWLVLVVFAIHRQRSRLQVLRQLLDWPGIRRLAGEQRRGRETAVQLMRLLALALWLIAWAGPEWGSERVRIERQALDIVFAVDCSKSMLAEDPPPNRRAVALRELSELMAKFQGNRLGLVGFAGAAFVFCPLTLDSGATQLFLEQLDENAIPMPGTAIGKAIEVALDVFPKGPGKGSRIIILLTDGEDHKSDPMGAARKAAQAGVSVYTVGVGSPEGAKIRDPDTGHFIRDASGQEVVSKMDEKTLQEIARLTGGQYLPIRSTTDSLDPIVKSVLNQERRKLESEMFLRLQPQFMWFVAAGIGLLLLAQVATLRVPAAARPPFSPRVPR